MNFKNVNLVWFRNNLRIRDNLTFHNAYKNSLKKKIKMIALFIATPIQWNIHNISYRKINLIYKSLFYLNKELKKLNINFFLKTLTDFHQSIKYLKRFCKKNFIKKVFYDYQFEFNEKKRDLLISKILKKKNIKMIGFYDNTLIDPNLIFTKIKKRYKKFSFFKKNVLKFLKKNPIKIVVKPKKNIFFSLIKNKNNFNFFKNFNFCKNLILEKIIIKKLINFLKKNNFNQKKLKKKKILFEKCSSKISAFLSLGLISIRQCLHYGIIHINNFTNLQKNKWLEKLIWREFYYYLFYHYEKISQGFSINLRQKKIIWSKNKKIFKLWKLGNTGYPIIDASMRKLNKTGWINNRLRMISANFLVKNLFLNWKKGEEYFLSQLIDGDFIINNGNWQWITSIGTDFVPYVRTFNPFIQSKKIDPTGKFIKKYIPEIKIVPKKFIHNPHNWLKKKNIFTKYPHFIINYKKSSKTNLLIFKNLKFKKHDK
ncbi:deoxyribodipyrimidine photo-lyase [Buchnera aphidicola]|uniref:cryptochrome/photolyase family protein n=1 Tax=Buchnera aphidicola TaxID=9 RepID=UPI0030EF4D82